MFVKQTFLSVVACVTLILTLYYPTAVPCRNQQDDGTE